MIISLEYKIKKIGLNIIQNTCNDQSFLYCNNLNYICLIYIKN